MSQLVSMVRSMGVKRPYIISDTDLHGAMSLLIAIKTFRKIGQIPQWYSHFEPTMKEMPVTNPRYLADALPKIVMPREDLELYILDIPIPVEAPVKFIETLRQYTIGKVYFIDHHGHSEHLPRLVKSGVVVYLTESSYGMSLYLPRLYNVVDDELEKWALIGAIADYDESIADKVSKDLEELVTDYLDPFFKYGIRQIEETQRYVNMYGNVGSIVDWIITKGYGPEDLLNLAREEQPPLPTVPHEIRGDVLIMTGKAQMGLVWKCLGKLLRESECPVGVTIQENPRGVFVVVATNWRVKSRYAPIVERVIEEVSAGRAYFGHPGARSIQARSWDDARELQERLVQRLNEEISRTYYVPKTVRLISEKSVSKALHEDFRALLRRLTDLIEAQRKMYEEYLDLKRRQVELLEELRREREARAD